MTGLFLLALIVSSEPIAPAEPLAPSGPWNLQYGENSCALVRSFGEDDRGVTLALRTLVLGSAVEFNILTPGLGADERRGEARISVAGIADDIVADFQSFRGGGGHRVVKLSIERAALATWPDAATVAVSADGRETVLALTGTSAALGALDACGEELLRAWSIDPAALAAIATPATAFDPNSDRIWSYEDYPKDALRAGLQGSAHIRWTIDTDGRVRDCRVTLSSGHESLDQAACSAIKRRGHYNPALDRDGNPVKSWGARVVAWSLPSG